MRDIVSFAALIVATVSVVFLAVQTKFLRKDLETRNYQDLITRVFSARDDVIENKSLAKIFEGNQELESRLKPLGISIQEFFWIIKYLTVWESYYYERQMGIVPDQTWKAYLSTLRLVFKTEKIKNFWCNYHDTGTFREDWIRFVNAIISGDDVTDPILPSWRLLLKKLGS